MGQDEGHWCPEELFWCTGAGELNRERRGTGETLLGRFAAKEGKEMVAAGGGSELRRSFVFLFVF